MCTRNTESHQQTMNQIYDRISAVEEFVILCNSKFDGFGKELGDLSTDVRTVLEWISQHFGTELECSRNRIHPQSIKIEIVTTPSSNTTTAETNTEGSFGVRGAEIDDGSDIQIVETINDSMEDLRDPEDNESVQSVAFDDGSDDPLSVISSRPRSRVRPRRSKRSVSGADLSANEEDATRESNQPVTSNVVELINLSSPHTVPKRGRPCKPLLQNKKAEPQPSQCDQCGKILKDAGSLRQHKATHKDIRPHVCPECGKAFRRKFHLKTHSLIHSGEKKHQCGYCGKLFLLPKDLVAHERIHTGERPYSCNTCPKSFNLKSHLKMHVRTHTGEKPYKCDLCEKAFSQSNSLRVHKKVHLKNQNNLTASARRELTSSTNPKETRTTTTTAAFATHNNNQHQIVEPTTQQSLQRGSSTIREGTETTSYEFGYHHQNEDDNSAMPKNGQISQDDAISHSKNASIPSRDTQLGFKTFQNMSDIQMRSTEGVPNSTDQLRSHVVNLNLNSDNSQPLVPNSL